MLESKIRKTPVVIVSYPNKQQNFPVTVLIVLYRCGIILIRRPLWILTLRISGGDTASRWLKCVVSYTVNATWGYITVNNWAFFFLHWFCFMKIDKTQIWTLIWSNIQQAANFAWSLWQDWNSSALSRHDELCLQSQQLTDQLKTQVLNFEWLTVVTCNNRLHFIIIYYVRGCR